MTASQQLLIRRYEAPDHDAVFELHNLALQAVGAHPGSGAWDDDLHRIDEVYIAPGGDFLVGCVGDEIVAMAAFKRTDATRAEVKRMRVHPDHQRRGFGEAILAAVEARARELGYATLHLDTTTLQTAAQAFYERNGYVRTGTDRYEQFELILYEKHLAAPDGSSPP